MMKITTKYCSSWRQTYDEYHGADWGPKKARMKTRATRLKNILQELSLLSGARPDVHAVISLDVGGCANDGDVGAKIMQGKTVIGEIYWYPDSDTEVLYRSRADGKIGGNNWINSERVTPTQLRESPFRARSMAKVLGILPADAEVSP